MSLCIAISHVHRCSLKSGPPSVWVIQAGQAVGDVCFLGVAGSFQEDVDAKIRQSSCVFDRRAVDLTAL